MWATVKPTDSLEFRRDATLLYEDAVLRNSIHLLQILHSQFLGFICPSFLHSYPQNSLSPSLFVSYFSIPNVWFGPSHGWSGSSSPAVRSAGWAAEVLLCPILSVPGGSQRRHPNCQWLTATLSPPISPSSFCLFFLMELMFSRVDG